MWEIVFAWEGLLIQVVRVPSNSRGYINPSGKQTLSIQQRRNKCIRNLYCDAVYCLSAHQLLHPVSTTNSHSQCNPPAPPKDAQGCLLTARCTANWLLLLPELLPPLLPGIPTPPPLPPAPDTTIRPIIPPLPPPIPAPPMPASPGPMACLFALSGGPPGMPPSSEVRRLWPGGTSGIPAGLGDMPEGGKSNSHMSTWVHGYIDNESGWCTYTQGIADGV